MSVAVKKQRDIEADWDKKSLSASIEAARSVITEKPGINGRAMISSLSELEWGWIAAAAVFAWINTKAKQAVEEGIGYDEAIRTMAHRDPAPWEAGAIETILPTLGDLQGVDWEKPLGEWSKDQIVSFSWQIHRLTDSAIAARDLGSQDVITRRISKNETERKLSAEHGGPLLARSELDDDIPF